VGLPSLPSVIVPIPRLGGPAVVGDLNLVERPAIVVEPPRPSSGPPTPPPVRPRPPRAPSRPSSSTPSSGGFAGIAAARPTAAASTGVVSPQSARQPRATRPTTQLAAQADLDRRAKGAPPVGGRSVSKRQQRWSFAAKMPWAHTAARSGAAYDRLPERKAS
jgi:hypothetical protein